MLRATQFPETRPSLLATLSDGPEGQVAWREFFERYAPAIYRVARMRGLDHDDADDIVQQAMVSISSHIGDFRYDRDRGRFRAWVRTIAENLIKQLWRKRSLPVTAESQVDHCPDDGQSIEAVWESEWRIQDMLWCLDQVAVDVSPRKMEAFRKYALEGKPAEEVAREMKMSVGHVYVTRHAILNKVRGKARELELADEIATDRASPAANDSSA